ncbi:MAG TPA: YgiT-type zinc finger protein [Vicinamibacteria bacterium]|nr:YgiT-type zinc finger protein [Vicinamibacteria bacterium]
MSAKLSRCFRCGSAEVHERVVEELVRQGPYVVALRLPANVCSRCGERYFERDGAATIEDVRRRLERGELEGFRVTGELLELVGTSR